MPNTTLISVNGKLHPLYRRVPVSDHDADYQPIDVGRPLLVTYLRFFMKYGKHGNAQTIMISNFVKAVESKPAAPEAVTLFNKKAEFSKGICEVSDFGSATYGHPLCYYTRSYMGQTTRLSTRLMDINDDGSVKALTEAVTEGAATLGSLPIFADFLPYVGLVKGGVALLKLVLDALIDNRKIVGDHDVDLYFNSPGCRLLQSGRMVCVPERSEDAFKDFALSDQNVLLNAKGQPYTDSTYFVLKVNAEQQDAYDNFDYFAQAADILARANKRPADATDLIQRLVALGRAANDADAVRQIQRLAPNAADPKVHQRLVALANSLSSEMREAVKPLLDQLKIQL